MRNVLATLGFFICLSISLPARVLELVTIHQPISLHKTDGGDYIEGLEEVVQASVLGFPYVVSGAIPEEMIRAVARPAKLPSNNEVYQVAEANLVVLCGISISAKVEKETVTVKLDISKLNVPEEIDLTARQVLKLTILAIKHTLEPFNRDNDEKVNCQIVITGAQKGQTSLLDLSGKIILL